MSSFFRSIAVLIALSLITTTSYASHILGMDLFYTWVSGNTYKITAILYGDCSPSSYTAFSTLPSSSPQICIYRGTTYVTTISLNIQAPTAGVDITPVCPADVGHTQCENMSSAIPGIKKFVYSANYTLPAPVTSNCWQFSYIGYNGYGSASGRSANITNLLNASATSIELVDTLDNTVYPNNSSTQFSVIPTPFFCINTPDTYNPGAVNPIDSFQIDLIAAMNSAYIYSGCGFGTPCTYTGTAWTPPTTPISPTTPLKVTAGTFAYNSSTGQLNFTPNATQRATVVYNVREYRHGTTTYVGSCQREMNFLVETCTHPDPHGAIDSSLGGHIVDSVHFTICQNSGPFNIYFDPREPGTSNTITVTSSGLPTGATLTTTGNGTTTPHSTFSWNSNGVTPGTYIFYITYTDNNCPLTGTTTQAITIVVTPAPTVSFTVISPATCAAKEVFTIIPGGTGSPWNINVTGTSAIPPQTFTGVTASFTDSLAPGVDTIWIASAAGSTCNSYDVITIAGPIAITIAATNPTVCAPANGSFTVSGLTPGGTYTIYYTVGGTPTSVVLTANGSGQITVSGLAPGTYTNVYAASGATGCVSNILSFTLTSISITITGTFANPTVCAPPNGSITLSGLIAGGSYTLYYTQSGTPHSVVVTASGSGQITISALPPGNYTGVYVVSNANGCQSNILTFTLVNPSDPPLPTLTGGPVCADSTLLLTGTDAVGGLAYSWTGPNGFTSTLQNPTITNAQTIASGVYAVTVTNTTTGCSSSNTLNVTVKPTPVRPVVTGNNPCAGSALNLGATSDPGSTYSWTGPNTFVSGVQNPSITPASIVNAGTYSVVATLNGCPSLMGTGTYMVNPIPPAPTGTDSTYCQGATVLPLTATGVNLLWYTTSTGGTGTATPPVPSDSTVGVLTWYVTQTINGCESPRAPINTTILYVPVFDITGNNALCLGASALYSYSGPPLSGAAYLWTIPSGDAILGGSVTSDSIRVQFNSTVPTQYITLTASDYGGKCSATETFKVDVVNPPLSQFYVKPDICVGDTVVVALSEKTPSATVFTWDFDGAVIIAANSNSGGPYSLSWLDTGIHIIKLTTSTDIGCITPPVFDTFNVHGLPDAGINPPKMNICLEDTILLTAVTDIYSNTYIWAPEHFFNWRSPLNDNGAAVMGIIQAVGDVTLTVKDPFGCVASSSVYFNPDPCCLVTFPDAFTPNGDGRNDIFRPIFKGYHTFHVFRIMNRWGQTVFETTNTNGAWDGNFNGVPQDMGVYFYLLRYDCNGKTVEAKGDVTLIR